MYGSEYHFFNQTFLYFQNKVTEIRGDTWGQVRLVRSVAALPKSTGWIRQWVRAELEQVGRGMMTALLYDLRNDTS